MKAIESVVGGYLLIIVLIAVITGFYAWIVRSSEAMNHQLSDKIDMVQYLSYPPTLSLIYEKDVYYKLRIQPTIPIFVKEVIVRTIQGDLVHREIVNQLVVNETDVSIPIVFTPAMIMVLAERGIVYYYMPRADPLLGEAPEHIRRKTYIDNELLEYIKQRETERANNSFYVISTIGYKILAGVVRTDPEDVIMFGPVQCPSASYQFFDTYGCNLNAMINGDYVSFVTYQQNRTLWNYTFDGYLKLAGSVFADSFNRSFHLYLQVLRVVRVVSRPSNITARYYLRVVGRDIKITYIAPVYYVVPCIHRFDAPLILTSRNDNSLQWINRTILARNLEIGVDGSLSYTAGLVIDPRMYGYDEVYVLTGLEVIYRGGGELLFKVEFDDGR